MDASQSLAVKHSSIAAFLWVSLARTLAAAMTLVAMAPEVLAYGSTQWEWRSNAIIGQTFPTKEAALAATKALGGGYALLDREEGVDGMSTAYTYYKFSVSPRDIIIKSEWVYITGNTNHTSEAAAIAFLIAWELQQGYSSSQCQPPQFNPRGPWFMISDFYGVSRREQRDYDDIRYGFDPENGCYERYNPPLRYVMYRDRDVGCPTNFTVQASTGRCVNFTTVLIYKRPLVHGQCTKNPCDVTNGSKVLTENDYTSPILSFTRYYHSNESQSNAALGVGWTHSFSGRMVLSGFPAGLIRPSGTHEPLASRSVFVNGTWQTHWISVTESGIRVEQQGSQYIAYLKNGDREIYSNTGRLLKLIDRGGLETALIYDPTGRLTSVASPYGHQLQFTYNATTGRLATVIDPANVAISYAYDAIGNLMEVTRGDGTKQAYLYEDTAFPTHLTGVLDETNTRFKTATYDSIGRVITSELAAGIEAVTLTYAANSTSVQHANGSTETYNFTTDVNQHRRLTSHMEGGFTWSSTIPSSSQDIMRRVTQQTDARGTVTKYTYDPNHKTSRVEAFGTPSARTTTYQYLNDRSDLPIQIDEPGKRTTFTHDANGNVLTKTELDTATSESRTWTYTYNSFGKVLTADGPRTDVSDVTTYTYYSCTAGFQCGQIETITNAAGHITTYNTYNAHGQPLTITDPNGLVTTLTYDLRQRLTSRTVGSEQATFDYWPTGLLKKATLPDGTFLEYTYDGAHRLTEIEDSEGNRIVYTLDAMGNRTQEDVFDPSSALTLTRTRVFNTLNQLWKEIGAAGTAAVTTTFAYDNNGNQTNINAPLARNTVQAYDELNRLKQVTDPLSGVTLYGYNALDQLISVTDPRSKVTTYTYNALGDLKQQVSPDTGTTVNTYDSGGNLATSTDARSKTGTYAYDALNRVTGLTYPDQTITYSYDTGTNQKGRLTQVSDASGSTSWSYDTHGRVLTKQQTMGSISKTVGYAYDSFGRLQTLTLPSGNTITYGYTDGKVTSLTLNGSTTILSNVLYSPFGLTTGWTWGNSTFAVREYDTDGKITDIDSAGLKAYSYDDAFRIAGITDASDPNLSQSYGYDLLDRLTSATGTSLNQGWTYDANGNRLTQTGSEPSTYTISSTSNRITGITGTLTRTYGYDNSGNTTSDGTVTFTYNDAGRMVSATKASVMTTYSLNAFGQRVKKTTSASSTYFVYDEAGHLLGEYDNAGGLVQEVIWLMGIPVAVLKSTGGSGATYFYVHTDQLGTPRRISRPNDDVVVWRWDSDPFGTSAPDQDPDGDSSLFVQSLRFPGQQFDSETELHYNYFRDYDPNLGRYIESDPIGLEGGTNTFGYVAGNPIAQIDEFGLVCQGRWRQFSEHINSVMTTRGQAVAFPACRCFWMCVPCRGPWAWSGNKFRFPRTTGNTVVVHGGRRPVDAGSGGTRPTPKGPQGASGAMGGSYACIGCEKPGAETGCHYDKCYSDANFYLPNE